MDRKREWRSFKNIRRNAMLTRMFRRKSKGAQVSAPDTPQAP
ncbi:MAG TPA: hypothetical protein VGB41_07630 [Acidimicrobiia bacterium]